MVRYLKKINCFALLILLCMCFTFSNTDKVSAYTVTHSGTGSNSGTSVGTFYFSGGWNPEIYGIRVTLVDKNGDRLKFTYKDGGRTVNVVSDSVDFYNSEGRGSRVTRDIKHSVCRKSNGGTTLCDRKDTANSTMEIKEGGYSWHDISEIGLSLGNYYSDGFSVSNQFKTLADSSNRGKLEKLFKTLMGVELNKVLNSSQGYCSANKKSLEDAYIIYEVLVHDGYSGKDSFIMTASEFSSYYPNGTANEGLVYILPAYSRALYVPKSTGNLGNKYFNAVNSGIPDNRYNLNNWNNSGANNSKNGYFMGILRLGLSEANKNNWKCGADFSVDAACQRCDSTDGQNKALIVQDTPDWEAILETKTYPNEDPYKKVKNYFSKGNGIVCREEIYTYFPNQNNIIAVTAGRYFTVNPSGEEMKNVISSGIPNFRPVKVKKIRQCKGADAGKLNSYANNAASKFKKEMGTVWFKYTENYSGSTYNNDGYQKMRGYGQTYSSHVSGDMLTMETSMNYTLPKEYYQYIYKANDLPVRQATNNQKNSGQYLNVGIANLPVSIFNNNKDAAKIQFAYDLPKDDGHKLGTAYTEQNTYLKLGDTKNIYANPETKPEVIRNSACAKMYGYNPGLYSECVKHRTSNAVGLRGSSTGYSSCFGKLDKNKDGSTPEGYICVVKNSNPPGNPPGNECSTEKDANEQGRSWNPEEKICCPVGKTYNTTTKKCEDPNDKRKCMVDESTRPITYYNSKGQKTDLNGYKADCPDPENICKIENGKYYKDGIEITYEQYKQDCDPGTTTCPPGYKVCHGICIDNDEICPPENICDDDCEYGCCPSGECAPMPRNEKGEIVCPGPGGLNIIYRPVDLKYTFPGQAGTDAGKSRNTGSNWCEYNIKTKKLVNCNSNNNVVKYYVNNKNTEVYSGDPLYEVKLDSKTISSIREYNRNQKSQGGYDDFTLKCNSKGKKCISQFLRGRTSASVTLENSSLCKSTNKSDFNKCDDSKKGSR